MSTLSWILLSGVSVAAIAFVGAFALLVKEATLKKWVPILVAFAAGSLIGGSLFHLLPGALATSDNTQQVFIWLVAGFSTFFILEQFFHWHHCHRPPSEHKEPLTYFLLIADALHNFIGGLGVGAAFLIDVKVGIAAWVAAAVHEIPQEIGDFGVLVHGGWEKKQALLYNFFSALSFPIGGVVAYAASSHLDVSFLVPFAAGNFLYIGAADLIPEVKKHDKLPVALAHFVAFVCGLALLLLASEMLPNHSH